MGKGGARPNSGPKPKFEHLGYTGPMKTYRLPSGITRSEMEELIRIWLEMRKSKNR